MKLYTISTFFGTMQISLHKAEYASNGALAVRAICDDGEPYAMLTVNLPETGMLSPEERKHMAFIDTNNCPELPEFLIENDIAKATGIIVRSGWCTYPLYDFTPWLETLDAAA